MIEYQFNNIKEKSQNVCCFSYKSHFYLFDLYNCVTLEVTNSLFDCVSEIKNANIDNWNYINKKFSNDCIFDKC